MFETINDGAAGFKPFTKKHFPPNFQLVSLNSIFIGDCLGTTFILSKNIFEDNKNGLAVN